MVQLAQGSIVYEHQRRMMAFSIGPTLKARDKSCFNHVLIVPWVTHIKSKNVQFVIKNREMPFRLALNCCELHRSAQYTVRHANTAMTCISPNLWQFFLHLFLFLFITTCVWLCTASSLCKRQTEKCGRERNTLVNSWLSQKYLAKNASLMNICSF